MNSSNTTDAWKRMRFKTNKVWAQTGPDGSLEVQNGTVRIKYNLKQDYEYKVRPESLKPVDDSGDTPEKPDIPSVAPKKKKKQSKPAFSEGDLPENCIKIYTDGASSGNPGPSGIGVLLIYGENKKKISRSIGISTNNIAELTAIQVALEELKRTDLPVRIFSDSSYCIGLLTKGWKPKKNQDLVFAIRRRMEAFKDLAFIKVKGHAGIKENEVADFLATSAIKKDL